MGIDTTDIERREATAESLLRAAVGALELLHVYLGDRLGLYAVLADRDDATPAELASAAGIAERYAREWLEQQAVAGLLDVAADDGDPRTRRYRLPAGVTEVFRDPDSPYHVVSLASGVASVAQAIPQVIEAFRTGGGVPYAAYGPDIRGSIARLNRPMFVHQLAQEWVPAMPDVEARLRTAEPPARVLDVGCGVGWSSIALARGYPSASVDGVDSDAASIEEARANAAAAGVGDRVRFSCRDAADHRPAGSYDLATAFECVHDMADPVRVLGAVRSQLAPGGAFLVGDEKVAETFSAPGDELERLNYGWSALHCLPASMAEPVDPGTVAGTVLRPDTLRRYAREAGFGSVTVLPVEHDFWRFYRLDP